MSRMNSHTTRWNIPIVALCATVLSVCNLSSVDCFHLSMVATRPNLKPFQSPIPRSLPFPVPPGGIPTGVTGNLVSQLAEIAIKLRLADHNDVTCAVTSKSSDLLLRGRVGPVTVKGRGWQSALGLTCRAIEATVDTCELDIGRILTEQKLRLTTPTQGKAMIALDGKDFGNFITHPLMQPPRVSGQHGGEQIFFSKENASVDPATGVVTFYSTYNGSQWRNKLKRGSVDGERATIEVAPVNGDVDSLPDGLTLEMARALSNFFNEMVFELDGTFLSFRDMMVTDKGKSPCIMLALNILVRKFPSRGVAF